MNTSWECPRCHYRYKKNFCPNCGLPKPVGINEKSKNSMGVLLFLLKHFRKVQMASANLSTTEEAHCETIPKVGVDNKYSDEGRIFGCVLADCGGDKSEALKEFPERWRKYWFNRAAESRERSRIAGMKADALEWALAKLEEIKTGQGENQ